MEQELILASICLSDIPKELIKKVTLKSGETKLYLNVKIKERKEPSKFGDTHFISCEPKKEERKEGTNYIIGNGKRYDPQPSQPTAEEIANAPTAEEDDLPFDLRGAAA